MKTTIIVGGSLVLSRIAPALAGYLQEHRGATATVSYYANCSWKLEIESNNSAETVRKYLNSDPGTYKTPLTPKDSDYCWGSGEEGRPNYPHMAVSQVYGHSS
jgi:hypothetical protein